MTDMEIRVLFEISADEYYEAMEGFQQWYEEINNTDYEPFD